jgi:peptidoglycan/xylan/chitin deacetylase (PgdA/CDA1 family)
MKISVLMYHDVVPVGASESSGFRGPGAAGYKLEWPRFSQHLDALARATKRPPETAERLGDGPAPGDAWALTFDDGGASAEPVGQELARRGWRGRFFIATECIGRHGFLDAEALRGLRSSGHVVGSHSRSHPERMSSLPAPQLLDEWRRSVEVLSELLGEPVASASVPGGFYSESVGRAAAKAGIRTLFTSQPARRVTAVDGCAVIGRFAVRRHMDAAMIEALAQGDALPWLRERALWSSRELLKRGAPGLYLRARAALLARRDAR